MKKEILDTFKSLSSSRDGQNLVQYLKELVLECESAKDKKSWEEVQGGLIAGRIIQTKVIDKLESLSKSSTKDVDESEFT
jgi:hypothetical protein